VDSNRRADCLEANPQANQRELAACDRATMIANCSYVTIALCAVAMFRIFQLNTCAGK